MPPGAKAEKLLVAGEERGQERNPFPRKWGFSVLPEGRRVYRSQETASSFM